MAVEGAHLPKPSIRKRSCLPVIQEGEHFMANGVAVYEAKNTSICHFFCIFCPLLWQNSL